MRHKIVAFRIKGHKGGLRVDALTQSPRGTKVFAGSREVNTEGKDKEAAKAALEAAVKELIAANQ